MRIKRLLFLLHRWFGVAMCLLFALWFATGVIMMYVEYPELTEEERLDSLPSLASRHVALTAAHALQAIDVDAPSKLVLTSIGTRPAYQVTDTGGRMRVVFADDGETFRGTDIAAALAAVKSSGFAAATSTTVRYDTAIEMDQWTVSEALDPHRPLHRVVLEDSAETVLYVSNVSGQIVRDTTRSERFWNWIGSTVHWIYPMQLRRHRGLWVNVIIYLSLAGIVSVATGAVIGIQRLRVKRGYRGGSVSPYRGVAKWHHVLGLVGLAFVSTFIFSGLMSVGPWGIFDSGSAATQIARYSGGAAMDLTSFRSFEPAALEPETKEVRWLQIGGLGHLVLSRSASDRRVWLEHQSERTPSHELTERIERSSSAFLTDAEIVAAERLDTYDDYYYSRHNRYRPLPVYRVKFDDAEETWFHIDLSTGEVISRQTGRSRLERWLYNGLHSLDFSFLVKRGLAWDASVIVLSVLGLIFSITSVVLAWRRLR